MTFWASNPTEPVQQATWGVIYSVKGLSLA